MEKVEASESGKGGAKVKVLESVVCPFCACLCDDVVVAVDEEAKGLKRCETPAFSALRSFSQREAPQRRRKRCE